MRTKASDARAQRFVEMHAGDDLFIMANPTNAGVAITLEQLGYAALGTSSAALARSLGRVDGCRAVERAEAIDHAVSIHNATTVPVSGDFEHGYGDDPHEVAETVTAAIAAGLAGCCIEDATGLDDPTIYDRGVAAERIAAAADAAGDSPFVLVARAENHLLERDDLADTIARLQSFVRAGAHAVFAPGLRHLDQIRAVVESVDVPVNVLVGFPDQTFSLDDLRDAGVRRVSVGSTFERIANHRLKRVAQELLASVGPVGEILTPS